MAERPSLSKEHCFSNKFPHKDRKEISLLKLKKSISTLKFWTSFEHTVYLLCDFHQFLNHFLSFHCYIHFQRIPNLLTTFNYLLELICHYVFIYYIFIFYWMFLFFLFILHYPTIFYLFLSISQRFWRENASKRNAENTKKAGGFCPP